MRKYINQLVKHPLFSGSMIMVGGSTLASALGYLYHLIMGRILGPVDYGTLASIFSLLQIVSIIPLSSSFAIVKFSASAKNKKELAGVYKTIKKFMWKLAIAASLVLILISPLISQFLHIDEVLGVVFVGPIMFMSLIILVDQAAMQGVLKFSGVVIPVFASAAFKLIFGVLFVIVGLSVSGAIGGMLLGLVLTYFITVKLRGNMFETKIIEGFEIARFFKYALPVLIQALAFTSLFTVDVVLVKHFLPPFEAGIYAALSNLGKIIYFASQPVIATMFPIVSKRRANGEKYKQIFLGAFLLTTVISICIVVFYWLLPDVAIGTLYGNKYFAAREGLVWMGIFMTIYTTGNLLVNFLLSIERTKIIVFPLIAAIGQIIGIIIWHGNIMEIIYVSLAAALFIFVSVSLYLSYNQFQRQYVKRR